MIAIPPDRALCPAGGRATRRSGTELALPYAALLLLLTVAMLSRAERTARIGNLEQHAQGYLGIEFHDLAQPSPHIFHLRPNHLVEVVMVDHDGPAGKAGLRAHDLIESVNGQPVSGAEALRQMIHDAGAGSTITLSVERGGGALTLTAKLESREDVERRAWAKVTVPPALPGSDEADSEDLRAQSGGSSVEAPRRGKRFLGEVLHGPSIGLQLQVMSPQLSMFFGAPPTSGLLVESVEPGSAAALAGMEAGDVLLRADSTELHTLSDWTKRLHASKGRVMSLVILREHHEFTVSLQANNGRSALDWPFRF